MIIKKLLDNYSVEKNEKEMLDLKIKNMENEYRENKNRLVNFNFIKEKMYFFLFLLG